MYSLAPHALPLPRHRRSVNTSSMRALQPSPPTAIGEKAREGPFGKFSERLIMCKAGTEKNRNIACIVYSECDVRPLRYPETTFA